MPDLSAGIRFEDDDTLVIWGAKMASFLPDRTARYEHAGDRTIYHWGKHDILGGLPLDLRTVSEDQEARIGDSSFRSIEHWAVDDDIANSDLIRIKEHVIRKFGPPTKEETTEDGEYTAEWKVEGAVIKIVFFEQDGLKLRFSVKQRL
ncbi:MAG: hypothetical protein ACOH13_08920 [Flavobacteriales bacterium]